MKKYLFAKPLFESIEIYENNIIFIPFREPTVAELFLVQNVVKLTQNKMYYEPKTPKEFLRLLYRTKLNNEGEYNINNYTHMNETFNPFDVLLTEFVNKTKTIKDREEDEILSFYTTANEIKSEAIYRQSERVELQEDSNQADFQ